MPGAWLQADPDFFFIKNDPSDPRLGEFVKATTDLAALPNSALIVAGYPDDEGVTLSKGRPGAALAPNKIRRHFYKMTPPLFAKGAPRLNDFGNLALESGDLANRHETVRAAVSAALRKNHVWAGLGGGHDYGYADGAGFLNIHSGDNPLVINIDAHLDVRPATLGLSSGTPFSRLFEVFRNFDLLEVGIQSQCNSRTHLDWVTDRGARVVSLDDMLASGRRLVDTVIERAGDWLTRPRPAYLSIDLDAFSTAWAPGVSQGFATGLEPREFFELFDVLCTRLNVRVLGLYETNPEQDFDDRTSKLAAQILHRFLQCKWPTIST